MAAGENEIINPWESEPALPNKTILARVLDAVARPIAILRNNTELETDPTFSKPETLLDSLRADQDNGLESARIQKRYDVIMESIQRSAKEMNVANLKILLTTDGNEAFTTREGSNYVALNKDDLTISLRFDEGTGVIAAVGAHEVAHIYDRDTLPWRNAAVLSDSAKQREAERIADLMAASPLGTHDPESLANLFKANVFMYSKAMKGHEPSDAEMKTDAEARGELIDKRHPSFVERIAYLERASVLMKQYEAGHSVVTHEERVAETEWMIKQILREIETKTLPEPSSLRITPRDAEDGLTPEQKAQVEAMKPLPMREAETPIASAAPAKQKSRTGMAHE